ncbi:MAG: hypothetical protein JO250_15565 [Armatimonadetes bacterium]|nr:hypothetical protein [Armatimonadota bacterium]
MPQYDLAGNPLPEKGGANPSEQPVRYDLAGNPLPAAPPPPPSGLPPAGTPLGFGVPAPAAHSPYGSAAAPSEEVGMGRVYAAVGVGVAVVIALIAFVILHALRPAPVPAPTAYVPYVALDKSFTCDAPSGWARASGGGDGGNAAGVLLTRGAARIEVEGDLAGSLMGDIVTSNNNQADNLASMTGQPAPPQTPPVEKLHQGQAKALAKKYDDYDEQPAQPLSSPVGDARISEWTGSGGTLVGKLHGYRVTLLGNERRYSVICQCPEDNWAVLQPAFQHVIASLAAGNG